MRNVILTNENGDDLGVAEIVSAHIGQGKLHKAFSIFIFTPDQKKLLIQRRSKEKMLWQLHWANTCCSHPRETDTDIVKAAEKRLMEECGFTVPLKTYQSFVYREYDPDGHGIEWENDMILLGTAGEKIKLNPDPKEVADMKWVNVDWLQKELLDNPKPYSPWLMKGLSLILQ